LRDTGALQSLVSSAVVRNDELYFTGEKRLIRGVIGDVIVVPLVEITLNSSLCSGIFLCSLVSTLPDGVALLVGNDLCCDEPISDVNVVTRSMMAAQAAKNDQSTHQNSVVLPTDVKNATEAVHTSEDNFPDVEILSYVAPLFDEDPVTIDTVNRDKLIELQQNDSSLQSLFALCDQNDSGYSLQSDVLVRVYRDSVSPPDAAVHQIVAPAVLRPRLLQIAHEIPAAAHLGVAKTTARLQRHFYWPGVTSNVKQFCRMCDVCQRLGKGVSPAVAPLHPYR